jgi:hypothetical protein
MPMNSLVLNMLAAWAASLEELELELAVMLDHTQTVVYLSSSYSTGILSPWFLASCIVYRVETVGIKLNDECECGSVLLLTRPAHLCDKSKRGFAELN